MQKFVIMVPKQYLKSTKSVIRRSIFTTNSKSCSKDCNFVPPKSGLGSSSNPDQDFVAEATKEIASLIHKDCMGKPNHRSPVSN